MMTQEKNVQGEPGTISYFLTAHVEKSLLLVCFANNSFISLLKPIPIMAFAETFADNKLLKTLWLKKKLLKMTNAFNPIP